MLLARSPPGGLGGAGAPPMCRPLFLPGKSEAKRSEVKRSEAKRSEANQKVASIWLKIAEQVAYG